MYEKSQLQEAIDGLDTVEKDLFKLTLFRVRVKYATSQALNADVEKIDVYNYQWYSIVAFNELQAIKYVEEAVMNSYLSDPDMEIKVTTVEPVERLNPICHGDYKIKWFNGGISLAIKDLPETELRKIRDLINRKLGE